MLSSSRFREAGDSPFGVITYSLRTKAALVDNIDSAASKQFGSKFSVSRIHDETRE